MRNLFLVLLSLLLVGCGGCAARRLTGAWDPMDDPRAASVQSLMRQTVQVDHVFGTLVIGAGGAPERRETTLVGTGTVVARGGDVTYVLTAGHVCAAHERMGFRDPDGSTDELPVLDERFVVWTIDMRRLEARRVYLDPAADLCDVQVDGVAGEVASVLSHDPPVGATVTHVGSPLGVLNLHRAYVQDGTYMGLWNSDDPAERRQMYALRTTHGSSGGGVFYRGMLFSVMSRVSGAFDQISVGSAGPPFLRAVAAAREAARK